VRVAAVAEVTSPPPVSRRATAELPARSTVAPVATSSTLAAERALAAPRARVPAFTAVVPVKSLPALVSVRVPVPDLVSPVAPVILATPPIV
jgi:hypothetical protein